MPDGKLKPGVFGFRTIDDCNAIVAQGEAEPPRRRDRRRPARPGSRPRAPEPRLRGPCRASRRASHGDAARHRRRRDPEIEHGSDGRQRPSQEAHHRGARRGRGHRARLQGRHHARLRHGRRLRRHQAQLGNRAALRTHRRARHRGRQPHALGRRSRTSTWSANARSTAARSTAWWRRCGSRPRCSPTTSPDSNPTPPITAPSSRPSSRSWASNSPPWASPSPPRTRDEIIQFTEPKRGIYKKLIVREGRLVGGILMGDISKAAYLMQASTATRRCPTSGCRCCSISARPARRSPSTRCRREMQVCNCNGVTKAAIAACVAGGMRSAPA